MSFSKLKEPASMQCAKLFYSTIKDSCRKLGLDYGKLLQSAKDNCLDYDKFYEDVQSELTEKYDYYMSVMKKKHNNDMQLISFDMCNTMNAIDAIYTFTNLPRLIYESDMFFERFLSLPRTVYDTTELKKRLSTFEDFILDFRDNAGYWNIMVRFVKCNYTITCHKGTNLPVKSVAILSAIDNRVVTLGQFLIVDGIFPNLLIDPSTTHMTCQTSGECKRVVKIPVKVNTREGLIENIEFCYMTQKKIQEGACSLSPFNPYDLLQIAAYAWDAYENRHTLVRKNSKRRNDYKQHAVHTVIYDDKGGYSVLPLHKYYEYEKTHKEWQGGHHSSPVAHDRREHIRILRNPDGSVKKVVTVKACRVNNDNQNTAYYKVKGNHL